MTPDRGRGVREGLLGGLDGEAGALPRWTWWSLMLDWNTGLSLFDVNTEIENHT